MADTNYKINITAVNTTEKAFKDITKGLKTIKSVSAVTAKAVGGIALAATGVAASFAAVTMTSTRFIDTLGKTASKLNVNVETLQKMRFAADQTGVSQTKLDLGLQRFLRRAAEAAKGTGEAKNALKELGIQLTDSSGKLRDADGLLLDLADAFGSVQDENDLLRLGFKLFDSEGVAVVNTLRNGSQALQDYFDEAKALGLVLDNETVRGTEAFNDSISKITQSVRGFVLQVVGKLAPAFGFIADQIVEKIKEINESPQDFKFTAQSIATSIMDILVAFLQTIKGMLQGVKDFVLDTKLALNAIPGIDVGFTEDEGKLAKLEERARSLQDILSKPATLGESLTGLRDVSIQDITRQINKLSSELGIEGLGIFADLDDVDAFITKIREKLGSDLDTSFIDSAIAIAIAGKDKIGKALLVTKKDEEDDAEDPITEFDAFIKQAQQIAKQAFNQLETPTELIGKGLKEAFMIGEQALIDMVMTGKASFADLGRFIAATLARAFIRKRITNPLMNLLDLGGEPEGNASGGFVVGGTPYMVGEKGKELFIPSTSGKIIPNNQLMQAAPEQSESVNVNFKIEATDASGFDELLSSRKNQIVAMISQAMNQKGKVGLI